MSGGLLELFIFHERVASFSGDGDDGTPGSDEREIGVVFGGENR